MRSALHIRGIAEPSAYLRLVARPMLPLTPITAKSQKPYVNKMS